MLMLYADAFNKSELDWKYQKDRIYTSKNIYI